MAQGASRERHTYYFAYGSNMHTGRMQGRVPSAEPCEPAVLANYELRFHKHGMDGTGKCNIIPCAPGEVIGVVYQVLLLETPTLDVVEGSDYSRMWIEVNGVTSGAPYRAFAYIAAPSAVDDSLRPETWYHEYVVAGAKMHRLPMPYIEKLAAIPTDPGNSAEASDRRRIRGK